MKIAITGATGQLGQLVVEHLLKQHNSAELAVLVRDVTKAEHFAAKGITVRAFDYDQPDQLAAALDGVERLLLISASDVGRRVLQHKHVIEAAKAAQVAHIFYTSLLHADQSTLSLAQEHRETEELIKNSGLTYTLLRNGWYTENYTQAAQQVIEQGILHGAAHDGKISSATRSDYAEAAAHVLTTAGHDNKIYELAGSASYTLTELADELSQIANKKVIYQNLTGDEFHQLLVNIGLPAFVADILVDADVQASQGALFSESKDLEHLLARPSTSLRTVLTSQLG